MTEDNPYSTMLTLGRQKMGSLKEFFSRLPDSKNSLYFILVLSLVLKIILFIALFNKPINNDGIVYISAAKQFASGNFKNAINIYHMPFYPLLVACVHFIVRDWIVAARLISLTALVLSVIPLFLLTQDLFNRKIAFWSCLAYAIAPVPNHWAIYAIRGPLFILFFAWAIYFAQRAICHKNIKYFLLATLFSWIPVFFRIEGIIFIPFYMIFLIILLMMRTEERAHIFKGLLIWTAFPFTLVLLMYLTQGLGWEMGSFNRFDFVLGKTKKVFNLGVFEKYNEISGYLENIQKQPPFSGYHQNFAEILKKYIPIIYFLGLLEKLIKVLFLFNIIPLIKGIRHRLKRNHALVFCTIMAFILLIYTRMIEKDFLSSRFLFIAAFLLFPWVGHGMVKMLTALNQKTRFKFLFGIFLLIFIIAPLGKIVYSFDKHDTVLIQAGDWLKSLKDYDEKRVVVNDMRILFYSGRDIFIKNRKSKGDNYMIYHNMRKDYSELESSAREFGGDLIAIRVSMNRDSTIPNFEHYRKIKVFEGKKDFIQVFISSTPSIQ